MGAAVHTAIPQRMVAMIKLFRRSSIIFLVAVSCCAAEIKHCAVQFVGGDLIDINVNEIVDVEAVGSFNVMRTVGVRLNGPFGQGVLVRAPTFPDVSLQDIPGDVCTNGVPFKETDLLEMSDPRETYGSLLGRKSVAPGLTYLTLTSKSACDGDISSKIRAESHFSCAKTIAGDLDCVAQIYERDYTADYHLGGINIEKWEIVRSEMKSYLRKNMIRLNGVESRIKCKR